MLIIFQMHRISEEWSLSVYSRVYSISVSVSLCHPIWFLYWLTRKLFPSTLVHEKWKVKKWPPYEQPNAKYYVSRNLMVMVVNSASGTKSQTFFYWTRTSVTKPHPWFHFCVDFYLFICRTLFYVFQIKKWTKEALLYEPMIIVCFVVKAILFI